MTTESLTMSDGWKVHVFHSKPEGKPTGHIHLMHGMADHIERYSEFGKFLTKNGYIVSGHDHRGHGKTAELNGKLGYLSSDEGFERLVLDAHEVITQIRDENPALPFILFGHSMGSFIAMRYLQLFGQEVDLAILSGTGGNPGVMTYAGSALAKTTGIKIGMDQPNKILNNLVFGQFNASVKDAKTPFDWLSTDSEAVQKYINDPNCGFIPTTQFFIDLFKGLGVIYKQKEIDKIPQHLPVLFISGDLDPVGNFGKGVWQVAKQFEAAGMKDVIVHLFEGGRHEMLNEQNREQVYATINNWMARN
jgi:alpha-beta hydrolase superfamily lysophospholipase